jgi:hypothetical protein
MKVLSGRAVAVLPLHILHMSYMYSVHGHHHALYLMIVRLGSRVLSSVTVSMNHNIRFIVGGFSLSEI